MLYSRLWAHDGNNSLKRMLPVGQRVAADTRLFESDYILPRAFVDRFQNEVKKPPKASRQPRKVASRRELNADGSESENSSDDSDSEPAGDPTDGAENATREGVDQCVKNWKAAKSDDKKRTWAIYDETGIYASACRHGFILWICDMVRSGELCISSIQHSSMPLIQSLELSIPWQLSRRLLMSYHLLRQVAWTSTVVSRLLLRGLVLLTKSQASATRLW